MKYWPLGTEWKPININDNFVKFKGEENISIKSLQKGFFYCMQKSDIFVICNPNSYLGHMASIEFGYATAYILQPLSTLKKIYFTNIPLAYDKFNSDLELSFDTFLKNLYNNPNYHNELDFYRKIRASKDLSFNYTCEEDLYYDLRDMYKKVLLLQSQGNLVIGIESLLDKNKKSPFTQRSTSDDDEYEL